MVVQVHAIRRSRRSAGVDALRAVRAVADQGGVLGRGRVGVVSVSGEAEVGSEARAERILGVMASESITAVYQPVFELPHQAVIGYEALARFPDASDYPISRWFRDAAEVGLSVSFELAAIRRALDALDALPRDRWLAINASPQTLCSSQLSELLGSYDIARVVLELTEHAQIADYGLLASMLAPLRAAGARVAVDDVGAGYASFQHVLELKPDIIKLDKALTCGLQSDPVKQALVRALVVFADEVEAVIIAEGVETVDELEALTAQGITCLQGYHLARPAPLSALIGSFA